MFTQVQIILIALFLFILVSTKNLGNRPAIIIFVATTLLHMYDHMYRVKRGPEHLFFLPKKEGYCGKCA